MLPSAHCEIYLNMEGKTLHRGWIERIEFYICGSVHRWSILIIVQRDACLVTLERGSYAKVWPVPEAVVTVLCIPDDGCGWNPNHVDWTCRIINRLLCVASRWTIININTTRIYFREDK